MFHADRFLPQLSCCCLRQLDGLSESSYYGSNNRDNGKKQQHHPSTLEYYYANKKCPFKTARNALGNLTAKSQMENVLNVDRVHATPGI